MGRQRTRWDWEAWMDERSRRLDEWGVDELERRLGSPRRVLELGSAEGYQLTVFERRGWCARGCDVNERAVRYAVEMLGVDAVRCSFTALPEPDGAYDLVVMFHTLEHVPDVRRTLDEVYRVLSPCGRVITVSPCADTVVSRTVGDAWFSDPDHMCFFSQTTIRRLLDISGFEVLDLRTWLGVAAPDGESGPEAYRLWRTRHTREDDRQVLDENQGDVMMVMALKR